MLLKHEVNSTHRQYYIDKVNEPIFKAMAGIQKGISFFRLLAALLEIVRDIKKYPQPTVDNVVHPNSKWLLETRDRYLAYEGLGRVAVLVNLVVWLIVLKLEHSPNYADRISWWVEETPKQWRPRLLNHPRNFWKEPKPYGGP